MTINNSNHFDENINIIDLDCCYKTLPMYKAYLTSSKVETLSTTNGTNGSNY